MDFQFSALLKEGLDHLGIEISTTSYLNLERYFNELKKWNKKFNLIAKTATDIQIVENHFLDSLTLMPHLGGPNVHLLDIGTGGGFPGLVCGAAMTDVPLSLVEPRSKRVSFLRHIVRTLDLKAVRVMADRLENLEHIDVPSHITCRAVTEVGNFLPMVERFAGCRAQVVMMKGPRWVEEVAGARQAVDRSSFILQKVVDYTLPFSGAKRSLLFFGC